MDGASGGADKPGGGRALRAICTTSKGAAIVVSARTLVVLQPRAALHLSKDLLQAEQPVLASALLRASTVLAVPGAPSGRCEVSGKAAGAASASSSPTDLLARPSTSEQAAHRELGIALLTELRLAIAFWHFGRSDVKPSQLVALCPEYAPADFTPSADAALLPQRSTMRALLMAGGASGLETERRGSESPLEKGMMQAKLAMLSCAEALLPTARARLDLARAADARGKAEAREALRQVQLLETLLLLCSVELRTEHAGRMLQGRVHCSLEQCEPILEAASRYALLARLLLHSGEPERALELWEQLGRRTLHESPTAAAESVTATIALLSGSMRAQLDLPPLSSDKVLHFSKWVLELYPEEGVAIFTNSRQQVDPEAALDLLTNVCGEQSCLVVAYLEWLLQELRERRLRRLPSVASAGAPPTADVVPLLEKRLRTTLAQLYIQQIEAAAEPSAAADGARGASIGGGTGGSADAGAAQRAGAAGCGDPAAASTSRGEQEVRGKLQRLLELSNGYDSAALLQRVRDVPVALADHSVLMARQGLHNEALSQLVYQRRDLVAAKEYCITYANSTAQWEDLACTLLELLWQLLPVGTSESSVPTRSASAAATETWAHRCSTFALEYVEAHAATLPLRRVCALLPPQLSLRSLGPLLRTVLAEQAHRRHDAQIRRGLLRAQNQQIRQALQRLRERRVVVTKERTCQASGKLIGDRVFVVYPNNTVVLFGARGKAEQESVCPVTGRDFMRLPIDPGFEECATD